MNRYHALFPSIITESKCDSFKDIRNDLIDWIYNYKKTTDGVIISNRGGWQSPSNFYLQESFSRFLEYIVARIESTTIYEFNHTLTSMWINVNSRYDYNAKHMHPGAILAGVMWIKCSDNCGELIFDSPNSYTQGALIRSIDKEVKEKTNYVDGYIFKPEEGKMLLFPASLYHAVEPNNSDEDRISIAFNLR